MPNTENVKTVRVVHWAVFDKVDDILENGVPAMDLFNALASSSKLHGTWAVPAGYGVDALWADYARTKYRHRSTRERDSFAIQIIADVPVNDILVIKEGRPVNLCFEKQMAKILYLVCDPDNGLVLKNGIPMSSIRRIAMACETKEQFGELYCKAMAAGRRPAVITAWGGGNVSFEDASYMVNYAVDQQAICPGSFEVQKFEILYEG